MTPRNTIRIDLSTFDAFLFDLDGVITRTAGLHASAWKKLFDDYLAAEASRNTPFVPFDIVADMVRTDDNFAGGRDQARPTSRSRDNGPHARCARAWVLEEIQRRCPAVTYFDPTE